MEKFSSIRRVVGKVSENGKKTILQESGKRFGNQDYEELKDKEREKTPKELQIINLANQLTNEIRQKYGLPVFDVPPENIHVIKKDEWLSKRSDGAYRQWLQYIVLKERPAGIGFMKIVVHEMLHFKSYNALQVVDSDDDIIGCYRTGLTVGMRDGKDGFFRNLDEAVVEEMTKNILIKLTNNPLFAEEVRQTREIMNKYPDAKKNNGKYLFDSDTFYAKVENGSNKINTANFTKKEERKILSILIDKLFKRNKEEFKSREDIFEIFSRAMMTGNIIPIGKLIDHAFGSGVFRKIGELDKNIQEQENFINSL